MVGRAVCIRPSMRVMDQPCSLAVKRAVRSAEYCRDRSHKSAVLCPSTQHLRTYSWLSCGQVRDVDSLYVLHLTQISNVLAASLLAVSN
jgi:hypothetical protein